MFRSKYFVLMWMQVDASQREISLSSWYKFSVSLSLFQKSQKLVMGKSRKRRKAGLMNNLKTERMQALARAQLDSENECSDNYEPPAKQERRFENQSSAFLMVISVLNSILKDFTLCRECRQGSLQCDVTSYSCMNTNLIFECNHCRVIR